MFWLENICTVVENQLLKIIWIVSLMAKDIRGIYVY